MYIITFYLSRRRFCALMSVQLCLHSATLISPIPFLYISSLSLGTPVNEVRDVDALVEGKPQVQVEVLREGCKLTVTAETFDPLENKPMELDRVALWFVFLPCFVFPSLFCLPLCLCFKTVKSCWWTIVLITFDALKHFSCFYKNVSLQSVNGLIVTIFAWVHDIRTSFALICLSLRFRRSGTVLQEVPSMALWMWNSSPEGVFVSSVSPGSPGQM